MQPAHCFGCSMQPAPRPNALEQSEIPMESPRRAAAWQLQTGKPIAPRKMDDIRNDAVMSILEFKGNWNIAKGKLKQQFARWTDDEQQFTEGKESELIGRIQKRNQQA